MFKYCYCFKTRHCALPKNSQFVSFFRKVLLSLSARVRGERQDDDAHCSKSFDSKHTPGPLYTTTTYVSTYVTENELNLNPKKERQKDRKQDSFGTAETITTGMRRRGKKVKTICKKYFSCLFRLPHWLLYYVHVHTSTSHARQERGSWPAESR